MGSYLPFIVYCPTGISRLPTSLIKRLVIITQRWPNRQQFGDTYRSNEIQPQQFGDTFRSNEIQPQTFFLATHIHIYPPTQSPTKELINTQTQIFTCMSNNPFEPFSGATNQSVTNWINDVKQVQQAAAFPDNVLFYWAKHALRGRVKDLFLTQELAITSLDKLCTFLDTNFQESNYFDVHLKLQNEFMLPHDSLHTYTLRMLGIACKCPRIPKNEVLSIMLKNMPDHHRQLVNQWQVTGLGDLLAKAQVHEYSAVSPKEHMAIADRITDQQNSDIRKPQVNTEAVMNAELESIMQESSHNQTALCTTTTIGDAQGQADLEQRIELSMHSIFRPVKNTSSASCTKQRNSVTYLQPPNAMKKVLSTSFKLEHRILIMQKAANSQKITRSTSYMYSTLILEAFSKFSAQVNIMAVYLIFSHCFSPPACLSSRTTTFLKRGELDGIIFTLYSILPDRYK